MDDLDDLRAKYQLSEIEISSIGHVIIETYTLGIKPELKPISIILGGQPGAGKSELTTAAQNIIGKNTVTCNADEYRDYHPKSDEIKQLHEEAYPEITVQYSQPWNNRLTQYCEENRFNFILETTFSSGEQMNNTIRRLKERGYEVYLMLLSVNKRLSFLGTRLRYEDMRARFGYGRLVNKDIHDEKYEKIATTLEAVQKEKLYDRIYIYGRAGRQKQKGMHNGLILVSENSEAPLRDYIAERDKEWSENDLRFFMGEIFKLIRIMITRKASYEDLRYVLDIFEVNSISDE